MIWLLGEPALGDRGLVVGHVRSALGSRADLPGQVLPFGVNSYYSFVDLGGPPQKPFSLPAF